MVRTDAGGRPGGFVVAMRRCRAGGGYGRREGYFGRLVSHSQASKHARARPAVAGRRCFHLAPLPSDFRPQAEEMVFGRYLSNISALSAVAIWAPLSCLVLSGLVLSCCHRPGPPPKRKQKLYSHARSNRRSPPPLILCKAPFPLSRACSARLTRIFIHSWSSQCLLFPSQQTHKHKTKYFPVPVTYPIKKRRSIFLPA